MEIKHVEQEFNFQHQKGFKTNETVNESIIKLCQKLYIYLSLNVLHDYSFCITSWTDNKQFRIRKIVCYSSSQRFFANQPMRAILYVKTLATLFLISQWRFDESATVKRKQAPTNLSCEMKKVLPTFLHTISTYHSNSSYLRSSCWFKMVTHEHSVQDGINN